MTVGTPGPGYSLLLRLGKDSRSYPKLRAEEQSRRTLRSGVHLAGPTARTCSLLGEGSGDATCPREGSARRR